MITQGLRRRYGDPPSAIRPLVIKDLEEDLISDETERTSQAVYTPRRGPRQEATAEGGATAEAGQTGASAGKHSRNSSKKLEPSRSRSARHCTTGLLGRARENNAGP